MKIGVTGASGMLGSAILKELSQNKNNKIYATSRSKTKINSNINWTCFDITNSLDLDSWLLNSNLDALIHCAASVDVDKCEKNKIFVNKLHIGSTKIISSYMRNNNKKLIYISSDSVFDGKKKSPYFETDTPKPLNYYAETKHIGEELALSVNDGIILRTNIIGWGTGGKISFFEWLLSGLINRKDLNLFDDVFFSPLDVVDCSKIIASLLDSDLSGIYNCASNNFVSKYEFGLKTAQLFNIQKHKIKKVSVDDMNFKAKRPKNMSLNTEKLKIDLKYNLPSYEDAILSLKKQYEEEPSLKSKII